MKAGEVEWVEVEEVRAGARGTIYEGRNPVDEGALEEGGWMVT